MDRNATLINHIQVGPPDESGPPLSLLTELGLVVTAELVLLRVWPSIPKNRPHEFLARSVARAVKFILEAMVMVLWLSTIVVVGLGLSLAARLGIGSLSLFRAFLVAGRSASRVLGRG